MMSIFEPGLDIVTGIRMMSIIKPRLDIVTWNPDEVQVT